MKLRKLLIIWRVCITSVMDDICESGENRMKKFEGIKPLNDLLIDAQNNGWVVDTKEFDEKGSDWIWIRDLFQRMKQIKYNPTNGWFYVWSPESEDSVANHMSVHLEDEEWYLGILGLLYTVSHETKMTYEQWKPILESIKYVKVLDDDGGRAVHKDERSGELLDYETALQYFNQCTTRKLR